MAQLALAWVLRRAELAAAIIGASRPEQVHENIEAADVELSLDILDAIDEALGYVPVTGTMLGPNAAAASFTAGLPRRSSSGGRRLAACSGGAAATATRRYPSGSGSGRFWPGSWPATATTGSSCSSPACSSSARSV